MKFFKSANTPGEYRPAFTSIRQRYVNLILWNFSTYLSIVNSFLDFIEKQRTRELYLFKIVIGTAVSENVVFTSLWLNIFFKAFVFIFCDGFARRRN